MWKGGFGWRLPRTVQRRSDGTPKWKPPITGHRCMGSSIAAPDSPLLGHAADAREACVSPEVRTFAKWREQGRQWEEVCEQARGISGQRYYDQRLKHFRMVMK